jgi:hypothetical protein
MNRGFAKQAKDDVDGAIADYNRAIGTRCEARQTLGEPRPNQTMQTCD